MKEKFEKRITKKPILLDGAMGTMLHSLNIPKGECYEYLNIINPGIVRSVHTQYLKAHAEILTTNTFGANRHILSYFGFQDSVEDINREAVNILRSLKGDFYIAGSVGPLSRPYEDIRQINKKLMKSIFKEQIEVLLENKVDIIKFETFSSLNELLIAFEVLRDLDPDIPAFCLLSFVENGKTLNNISPKEAFKTLSSAGSLMNGANCGIGPQSTYQIVNQIVSFSKYCVVQPNAGQPSFHGGQFSYPVSPNYFAEYAKKFLVSGVDIIGGCCGTTPEHISRVHDNMIKPYSVKKVSLKKTENSGEHKTVFIRFANPFKQKLKKEFSITVEIDPPKGIDNSKTLNYVKTLNSLGVKAVNIADNPLGKLRQSISAISFLSKREIGMDVIIHFTCRDKNLIGIQSELLSLYSLGINNILAITGDPPSVGDYPFATAVYEVNSTGLIEIISNLNRGMDYLGNPIPARTDFFIGAAAGMDIVSNKESLKHLKKKINKGAGFIQTQPVYSVKEAKSFSDILKKLSKPFIIGVLPLISFEHAEFISNEIHGINIPPSLLNDLKNAQGKDVLSVSMDHTVNMVKEIKNFVPGICIMTPFNRYGFVIELIKKINDS